MASQRVCESGKDDHAMHWIQDKCSMKVVVEIDLRRFFSPKPQPFSAMLGASLAQPHSIAYFSPSFMMVDEDAPSCSVTVSRHCLVDWRLVPTWLRLVHGVDSHGAR